MIKLERRGVDVKVWIDRRWRSSATRRERSTPRRRDGAARARARIDVFAIALPGAAAGTSAPTAAAGSSGSRTTTGRTSATRSPSRPPAATARSPTTSSRSAICSRSTASTSRRTPRWATTRAPASTPRAASTTSAATPARSTSTPTTGPAPRSRSSTGSSARCRSSASARSGRRPGHFDHIHIDVANSGAIGVGGGDGGAVGALEETGLDVKLIDWDAAYMPFGGFGGLGSGGFYGGPPDPDVASDDLRRARRHERLAEDPPGDVRDRDRRVRRAQPPLRRPRLGRRLPAAHLAGLGPRLLDHGPRGRGGRVHPPRDPIATSPAERRPALAGRPDLRVPVALRPGRRSRRWRCCTKFCGTTYARLLAVRPALGCVLAGCGVLDDEGPAALASRWTRPSTAPRRPCPAQRPAVPLPQLVAPTGAVARALDDGAIGVVDLGGGSRDRARDARHRLRRQRSRAAWTRWGAAGRGGRGRDADARRASRPARPAARRVPARIALSGVKTCDGRRYFEHGRCCSTRADARRARQPATYLRAPC